MMLVELEQRVIDYLRSASIHAQVQARAHAPQALSLRHGLCLRPPPLWRTATANAPRSAGLRRAAHMPTDTLRATALRRKEDDEMQRMDQLEQVWFGAIISPPLRVAPTTARPCLALPSGPFDGCACSSGVHTPRCAQEQENAEFEASAKGRGLFGSTLFADDEDDGRGRSIQIVDSHKSCACALRSNALHCTALHCTALHCTALHCRGQSNASHPIVAIGS